MDGGMHGGMGEWIEREEEIGRSIDRIMEGRTSVSQKSKFKHK